MPDTVPSAAIEADGAQPAVVQADPAHPDVHFMRLALDQAERARRACIIAPEHMAQGSSVT